MLKAANRSSLATRDTSPLFDKLRISSVQHESDAIVSLEIILKSLRKKHRNREKIQNNVYVLSDEKITESNKHLQKITVDENQKRDQCGGYRIILN